VVSDLRSDGATQVADAIATAAGRAAAIACDVTAEADLEVLVKGAVAAFAGIDIASLRPLLVLDQRPGVDGQRWWRLGTRLTPARSPHPLGKLC
jgi:hypothetical protein